MTNEELDVEQLRTELETIKDAMGIEERYRGATSMWLLFGFAVPVAAGLSQYVFLERLASWWHGIIWTVVLAGGYAVWATVSTEAGEIDFSTEGKPNVFVQFALVYLAVVPIRVIVSSYTPELGYVAESTMTQALIVVLIGVAYGIFGTSLEAYYVRWRDRAVFYVGTVWMVTLGVAIPQLSVLQRWPYAAFGGLYFVYAIATYAVLTRT